MTAVPYTAPGPGPWQLETAHFSRPLTHFIAGPTMRGVRRGWVGATARYGLLLDHFETATVNGFLYCQPVPAVGKGSTRMPPKWVLQLGTRLHPVLRGRVRQSHRALETRVWREDLRRWDEELKPASLRAQRALQAVDPAALSDSALATHLVACRDNLERMVEQHHAFTVTCGLPLGDFLAFAGQWSGQSPAVLLQLLSGSSRISLGVAAAELERLAEAVRADPSARAALSTATSLDPLLKLDGPVGEATRAYLEVVGYRSLGYDVCDPYGLELPEALLRAVRAAVNAPPREALEAALEGRVAAVREAVPFEHRETFESRLLEARNINRLRDERGVFSDCWAAGLARRAVLEVGKRLAQRKALEVASLAVDASCEELLALLDGGAAPTSSTLRDRARWRQSQTVADAPRWLGFQPSLPPSDWLPKEGRRGARAFAAFLSALLDEPERPAVQRSVTGLPASPGVYEGIARVVSGAEEFDRVQAGDVLVAPSTSPTFNLVLPLLGAIVTDRGGQLCHAAIVAREFGIPGVVGTREATRSIPDGARVRVDGTTGEVRVL